METSIGRALREAMALRGITVADLARDLSTAEPTLRNIVGGRTRMVRDRELRDRIDRYLDAPAGTTLRICVGELERYPTDQLRELYRLAGPLPERAVGHLVGLLRALAPHGAELSAF